MCVHISECQCVGVREGMAMRMSACGSMTVRACLCVYQCVLERVCVSAWLS